MRELLKSFYTLTQIRIVILDAGLEKVVEYPEEDCPFCSLIRASVMGARGCMESDRHACEQCRRASRFYSYTCHAGLMEAVAPIRCGNLTIGYIMLGQVRVQDAAISGWAEALLSCAPYELDADQLRRAYEAKRSFTKEQVLAGAQLLEACAGYLFLQRLISVREDSLANRLDAYLAEHLSEAISVEELCKRFHVSRSKLYQTSCEIYGTSITRAVRSLRINKAKELLSATDRSLSEIAALAGYNDYNYFIKVFRSETGLTPMRYCIRERRPG